MAMQAIEAHLKAGYQQVYDADLSAYFDTIPQDRLLDKLMRHVSDQNFLALIRQGRIEEGIQAAAEQAVLKPNDLDAHELYIDLLLNAGEHKVVVGVLDPVTRQASKR